MPLLNQQDDDGKLLNDIIPPQESYDEIVEEFIFNEQWDQVELLHDKCDPAIAREPVSFVVQGDNTTCLPLHRYLAEAKFPPPLSLIDKLVSAYPTGLLERDSRRGQLPLHMALLVGSCPFDTIRYIVEAMPSALQEPDGDGNLPLHYAAMFAPEPSILLLLLDLYPGACKMPNAHQQYPLHLLCARYWNKATVLCPNVLEKFIVHHPRALRQRDRSGRLPLHLSCSNTPEYDVLKVLLREYPRGLLEQDSQDNTPLMLVKKFGEKQQGGTGRKNKRSYANDAGVLTFIRARTQEEQKKKRRKAIMEVTNKVVQTLFPSVVIQSDYRNCVPRACLVDLNVQ